MEAINSRRSIRKWKDKQVEQDIIDKLVDAAQHAPFCGKRPPGLSSDYTPWEFIVVKDKATKQKFTSIRDKNNKFIADAPAIIVICVDRRYSEARWIEDGSIAAENILLAAHALGLGAVWLCAYSASTPAIETVTREALGLPAHIQPVVMIALGYPDEEPEPKKVRTVKEVTHLEKF